MPTSGGAAGYWQRQQRVWLGPSAPLPHTSPPHTSPHLPLCKPADCPAAPVSLRTRHKRRVALKRLFGRLDKANAGTVRCRHIARLKPSSMCTWSAGGLLSMMRSLCFHCCSACAVIITACALRLHHSARICCWSAASCTCDAQCRVCCLWALVAAEV